jgi:hypothetical protein
VVEWWSGGVVEWWSVGRWARGGMGLKLKVPKKGAYWINSATPDFFDY